MKNSCFLAAPAALAVFAAAPAYAQGPEEAFPSGFYGGITVEQAEVEISSAGFSMGDIEDDPAFGALIGGRLNAGSGVVLSAEVSFSVPQGMRVWPREVWCDRDECGEELSFESEEGIAWSLDATLGAGYKLTDRILLSVGGGAEFAEASHEGREYEDGELDYIYERTFYALGWKAFARLEVAFDDGWKGRVELSRRELVSEKWASEIPGEWRRESEQAFKGNALEIGLTKDF